MNTEDANCFSHVDCWVFLKDIVNIEGQFVFFCIQCCGSGSKSGSGCTSQRHGSADPDPDPHQYAIDPQHC